MNLFENLFGSIGALFVGKTNGTPNWMMMIMWVIGGVLIYLAIKKGMEPTLLLPIGFGAIIMNFPGIIQQFCSVCGANISDVGLHTDGMCPECFNISEAVYHFSGAAEPLNTLYNAGIANELFPLILFIGIGAMIDFGPLLNNPKLMIFGAAAQFGIFFTLCLASVFFPEAKDYASIAIIGAADGPTSIVVANTLGSNYIGAITVAAYSYMALVPVIQPPVIKMLTTKNERRIRMSYKATSVSLCSVTL